ncbi:MAG TPA: collagen-binding domain-containing protein, partial [Microbacterium sp.]|nr:collagen-binding domain-containing protein [Microbacterium sp.]
MSPRRTPRPSRLLAGITAVALAATGLVAGSIATAPAAQAAPPATLNPFSLSGGFTVYARENALLQNQETEGSIAVGGTATVQGSSGTYSIIHVSAGTADYTLPTVDGDPTRFLTGAYATASTGILAITSAGTSVPSLQGDLKLVDRTGPFRPFARADWIRLNTNPSNVDQTPLIDATHQQYPAGATPPTGTTGGGSIYTANTGATAVADYVEANADASWTDTDACLADLPTTGVPATVNTSASAPPDRVVLNPLSADQVNVLDYAALPTGTKLLQFSSGPTPGVANPLVIRVPAGTTAVNGLTIDPQGQYSPYLLWDLSEVTGPVTVTAPSGGGTRMDGSIYAPNADLTVTASPLDGQILGQNVTVRGGEVHSFLFAGDIACQPLDDPGTFEVAKALQGITAGDLPVGTVFTVDYTATLPDGAVEVGSLDLPADGTVVPAGVEFPPGTVVTFDEVAPPTVPDWSWGTPSISPESITIASGATATVTVTNAATSQLGTVTLQKRVVDQ